MDRRGSRTWTVVSGFSNWAKVSRSSRAVPSIPCAVSAGCTGGVPGMNLLGCVCVGGGCGDVETDASEFSNSVPAALGSPGAPMAA